LQPTGMLQAKYVKYVSFTWSHRETALSSLDDLYFVNFFLSRITNGKEDFHQ